jgi:hypothetical protein
LRCRRPGKEKSQAHRRGTAGQQSRRQNPAKRARGARNSRPCAVPTLAGSVAAAMPQRSGAGVGSPGCDMRTCARPLPFSAPRRPADASGRAPDACGRPTSPPIAPSLGRFSLRC